MSLEKGFLRQSSFNPSRVDWFTAAVIFLAGSFFPYLLIIKTFEGMLLTMSSGFLDVKYRHNNEVSQFYEWFFACISSISGLSWALRYLLRKQMNTPSRQQRFRLRLAYNYMGFNLWTNLLFITRFGFFMAFLALILYFDHHFKPHIEYLWLFVLLVVHMFIGTWHLAHRFFKKNYFHMMRLSALSLLFSFLLMWMQPIDYSLYNRAVKRYSIFANGPFSMPTTSVYTLGDDYQNAWLFVYEQTGAPYPKLRLKQRGSFDDVAADQLSSLNTERFYGELRVFVDKGVTVGQLWAVEKALAKLPDPPKLIYHAVEESYDPQEFYYYQRDVFESRELAGYPLIERKKSLAFDYSDIDIKNQEGLIHIDVVAGELRLKGNLTYSLSFEEQLRFYFDKFGEKTAIVFELDPDMRFEQYVQFKTKIKQQVIAFRAQLLKDKYGYKYYYIERNYTGGQEWDWIKGARQKFPLRIINHHPETGWLSIDGDIN